MARGAKFLVLYKRGGQRVLINEQGDMIVRPNPIEASLHLVPCSGSVAQHLLTSYLRSLLVVMVAQFSHKRIKGGMTGVVQLAQRCKPIQVPSSFRPNSCRVELFLRVSLHAPELLTLICQAGGLTHLQPITASRHEANYGRASCIPG